MEKAQVSGVIGQKWWPYDAYVTTIKKMNVKVSTREKWNVCAIIAQDTVKEKKKKTKLSSLARRISLICLRTRYKPAQKGNAPLIKVMQLKKPWHITKSQLLSVPRGNGMKNDHILD